MSKRIWRNGEYIDLVVHLSFTEEESKRLLKHFMYSSGAHMGIPPAGYKGRYELWKEHHYWKLELNQLIAHQLKWSRKKDVLPADVEFCPGVEELLRREAEGYYDE